MKWEKIKELRKNKYTKPLVFFGFYIIFFTFVFVLAGSNDVVPDNKTEKDMWLGIVNNYEYLYEVTSNENQIISLEGKKYSNKDTFIKKTNNIIDSEVYIFYDKVSIKQDDSWIESDNFVLIDDKFNNQYFDIKYIKDLIDESELVDSIVNFDGSKSDTYAIEELKIEVISEENKLKKIIITDPLYNITLQYRNINKVEDFVVEK